AGSAGGNQFNRAQYGCKVDLQEALRSGRNGNIAPERRDKAGQRHADGVKVRRQRVESKFTLLVSQGTADELIVTVVKRYGCAHLRDPGPALHLPKDPAGERSRTARANQWRQAQSACKEAASYRRLPWAYA